MKSNTAPLAIILVSSTLLIITPFLTRDILGQHHREVQLILLAVGGLCFFVGLLSWFKNSQWNKVINVLTKEKITYQKISLANLGTQGGVLVLGETELLFVAKGKIQERINKDTIRSVEFRSKNRMVIATDLQNNNTLAFVIQEQQYWQENLKS
jgi:hypothetical protein